MGACCGRESAAVHAQLAVQTQTLCMLYDLMQSSRPARRHVRTTCRCHHTDVQTSPASCQTSDVFEDALDTPVVVDAERIPPPQDEEPSDIVVRTGNDTERDEPDEDGAKTDNGFDLNQFAALHTDELDTGTKMMYILRLESGKWYVGVTQRSRLYIRINEHKRKVGAAWTTTYAVEDVVDVVPVKSKWDEDNMVKSLMEMHGIDNVRGGTYSKPKLSADVTRFLTNELRHNNGLCLRCGGVGHMMRQCTLSV